MYKKGHALLFLLLAGVTMINIYACGKGDRALEKVVKNKWKMDKRDRIDMAVVQEYEMTRNPMSGEVSKKSLEETRQFLKKASSKRPETHALSDLEWEERGPNNVAGRTRAILVDNNDPTANTVFVGSIAGGLWHTSQANQDDPQWKRISDIPNNVPISTLCQHPLDPNIMYCGTGEGYYNLMAEQGNGVYRSTNAGRTWELMQSTQLSIFHHIQKIVVAGNGAIFVGTRANGVMVSRDDGKTFHKTLGKNIIAQVDAVSDIELASNGDLFVALGLYETDGIYKSTDNGRSWIKLTDGLPTNGFSRVELACAQSNSQYIYAIMNNLKSNNCQGIFRSTDGGKHWMEVNNPEMSAGVNFLRQQGWYNLTAAVDPWDESTLYIGGIDLFKTTNAGLSFQQISHWYGEYELPNVHADQHAIVFGKNSDNIFFGNDGGIWRTENASSEHCTIEAINTGYNVTQFYSADFHPSPHSHIMTAGAQDNGTQLFTNKGINSTVEISGGDGGFTHVDQTDGNTIISSYVFNNYRISTDGGKTNSYFNFGNSGKFINPTDYDDVNNILYAAGNAGNLVRFKLSSENDTYEEVEILGMENQEISAIIVSPHEENQLYIGTDGGAIYMLDNVHQSNKITAKVLFHGRGYVSSITIDHSNNNHIVFSYSNYGIASVYESWDAGKSWECVEGNLPDMPVRCCVIDPTDNKKILLATDLGIWYCEESKAEKTEWKVLNNNMESVRVDMLKFRQSDNMLLAATHGRGMFTTDYFTKQLSALQ